MQASVIMCTGHGRAKRSPSLRQSIECLHMYMFPHSENCFLTLLGSVYILVCAMASRPDLGFHYGLFPWCLDWLINLTLTRICYPTVCGKPATVPMCRWRETYGCLQSHWEVIGGVCRTDAFHICNGWDTSSRVGKMDLNTLYIYIYIYITVIYMCRRM